MPKVLYLWGTCCQDVCIHCIRKNACLMTLNNVIDSRERVEITCPIKFKCGESVCDGKFYVNGLTAKSVPAGTKNSRLEGFLLAKHKHTNVPTMMELFPPPVAWVQCICQSPIWKELQTDSGTPRFGMAQFPCPNQFGESLFLFGDCVFGFFFSHAQIGPSHQNFRRSNALAAHRS